MTLPTIIQDRTNDGTDIVDFLVAVMRNELAGFKPCHRLDAAKLLVKYDCSCKSAVEGCKSAVEERDEALNFSLDYIPGPSRTRSESGSSEDPYFDRKLAKVIQDSTDDGRSVCRFLINVMDGELKAFKPHHRISAARELLSRGFGKQAYTMRMPPLPQSLPRTRSGGEKHESEPTSTHPSTPSTQTPQSEKSPNPINQSSDNPDDEGWAAFWEKVTPILEEDERRRAEQEPDPDNPPHVPDLSVFNEAWDNTEKWFDDWKNSLDPEEYEAIVEKELSEFHAMIDTKIERRKQIAEDREQREKEEAERQLRQAKARAEAKEKAEAEAKEEEDLGPPPAREDHKTWSPTPSIPTSFRLVKCGHPKCKLHDGPVYYPEDDRSSPYYNPGYAWPVGPSASTTSAVFDDLMSRRRPP